MSVKILENATLRRVVLFACLVILPLIFRTDTLDTVWSVRLFILGLSVFTGLILLWKDRKALFSSVPASIQLAWLVFLLTGIVGIAFSQNAWEGIFDSFRLFTFTGLFYFFYQTFRNNESSLNFAIRCLVALTTLLGLVGALQISGFEVWLLPKSQSLAFSTMGGTNFLGGAMLFLLPVNLGAVLRFKGAWRVAGVSGILFGLWMIVEIRASASLLGLGFLVLLLTWFGLVILLEKRYGKDNLPLVFRPRLRNVFLLLAFLVVAASAFFIFRPDPSQATAWSPNTANDSGIERLILWESSFEMLTEHPVLGVGAGNWKFHVLEKGLTSQYQGFATRFFVRAHNDFFQAFAERGIFGGTAFLFFVLAGFYYGLRQFDRETDWSERIALGMALCGLLTWMVIASFSFPSERPFNFMMLFFFIALSVRSLPSQKTKFSGSAFLLVPLIVLVLFSSFLAFLTMDSEVDSRDLFEAKHAQNWPEIIRISEEADQWPFEFERHTFTPYAWYAGNAYLNLGQNNKARQALERAVDLQPWHPQVLSNLGIAFVSTGDLKKGAEVFEDLLLSYPDFHDARTNLTEVYLSTGDKADVLRTISYWENLENNLSYSGYLNSVKQRLAKD